MKVGIVISSTRPTRICKEIAEWAQRIMAAKEPALSFELIDLATINLPFLDEPLMPALGKYKHQHTKEWSALVNSYQAFVFVLPQYNWGYPAPLKNALDFLYAEWANKPAAIITYGNHGGVKASMQLKTVLEGGLHMKNVATNPELSITKEMFHPDGRFKDIKKDFASFEPVVAQAASEIALGILRN
jgi:NAD(P)H-dependent FMN reductase